jgi:hypothetical protein
MGFDRKEWAESSMAAGNCEMRAANKGQAALWGVFYFEETATNFFSVATSRAITTIATRFRMR